MILQLVVRSHKFQRKNGVIILWAFWLKDSALLSWRSLAHCGAGCRLKHWLNHPPALTLGCWASGLQLVHSALGLGGVWHQIGCSDANVGLKWRSSGVCRRPSHPSRPPPADRSLATASERVGLGTSGLTSP